LLLPSIRTKLIEDLIAWWDRQVVLSLLKKRSRKLTKSEVQRRIQDMILEHSDRSLPDHFSDSEPPSIDKEVGLVMKQQILWVKGGKNRINRAALARWRARNQRQEWLDRDFAAAADLEAFDKRLIEVWDGRFGPMKDDCSGKKPAEHCQLGLALLDWSHHQAPHEVRRIRPDWTHAFLVQGSYQQLAEEAELGWHPDYEKLVTKFKAKGQ
ncbi:MAG: hypothetical protein K1X67_22930, partial [Fimbriimonadaceae bacterium]|nr:hypothetical protein [Fimbriimonadaceae bacterium]